LAHSFHTPDIIHLQSARKNFTRFTNPALIKFNKLAGIELAQLMRSQHP